MLETLLQKKIGLRFWSHSQMNRNDIFEVQHFLRYQHPSSDSAHAEKLRTKKSHPLDFNTRLMSIGSTEIILEFQRLHRIFNCP